MATLRCSQCDVNWPPNPAQYSRCPLCDGITWNYAEIIPILHADAAELLKAKRIKDEYEHFVAARDKGREEQLVTEFHAGVDTWLTSLLG